MTLQTNLGQIKGTISKDYNSFGDMWTLCVNKINGVDVDFLDYQLSEINEDDSCVAYATKKKDLISYLNELERSNELFLIKR